MAALAVLIITAMAAGYGLWLRHSCVKEIQEHRLREVREMRTRRRKRR